MSCTHLFRGFGISDKKESFRRTPLIYLIKKDNKITSLCLRLTGCCWLPLNEAGAEAGYILRARAVLTNRSDTGRINSSPISAIQPVFRLNQRCDYTIKIPGM